MNRLASTLGMMCLAACVSAETARAAPVLPFVKNAGSQSAETAQPQHSDHMGQAPDLAYGAFQRGYYLTALREAMKRLDSNANDTAAMTLIGELYDQGLGVKLDFAEAARWYTLAADRGNREAIFALGLAKLQGKGIGKDRAGAKALFAKAAALNEPGALYNLGVLAVDGTAAPDFAKAAGYFRRAAELSYPDAAYSLALCYRYGKGVPMDGQQAAAWMKRAADEDQVPAEVEYAIMLFNGTGVDKDEAAAARLFLKAAAHQNHVAQDRIARLLATGRGIKKDVVEAMKWHLIARAAGEKDAWLDDILATLTPAQRVQLEAAVRQYTGD